MILGECSIYVSKTMMLLRILLLIVVVIIIMQIDRSHISNVIGGNDHVVKYYVVESDIDPSFTKQVKQIISNSNWNNIYKITSVNNAKSANVLIHLTDRDRLDKYHTEPEYYAGSNKQIRFSITEQSKTLIPHVYIDANNWLHGVKESGLTLEQYRRYVIEHEFGHALGHDHLPCKNGVCPVMYQATRGCGPNNKCSYMVTDQDLNGEKLLNRYDFA